MKMADHRPTHQIATFFLVMLVLSLNAYIYAVDALDTSQIVPHLYYGALILAGLYAGRTGQYLLLILTSVANLIDALVVVHPPIYFATVTLYPFVGLFILHTIRSLRLARERVDSSLEKLDASHRALEKRVLELTALFDVSDAAASNLDLERLFQQVMRVLAQKLGMYRGTLSLWDNQSQILRVEAAYGLTEAEKKRGQYLMGEGLTGTVMATGEPLAVKNVGGETEFLNRMGARELIKDEIAFLCVPINIEGETLGTLSVDKASDRFSLEDDLRILRIVSSVVAQAVKINQMVTARVASERLVAIGKLATTVAHEVRNPLGGIRGAAQLLEVELPLKSEGQEYIHVILTEVDRLNTVIENLLIFRKPQSLDLAQHDIQTLLQCIARMYTADFASRTIECQLEIPEELPPLLIDADQFTQVFHNFIRNAMEAMPEGGALRIQVVREQDTIEIHFHDTGTGIPPSARQRLFDPFYTTKPKGTGLGLAISQQIIREHQGRIEWRSSPSEGTCFAIILPLEFTPKSRTLQQTSSLPPR